MTNIKLIPVATNTNFLELPEPTRQEIYRTIGKLDICAVEIAGIMERSPEDCRSKMLDVATKTLSPIVNLFPKYLELLAFSQDMPLDSYQLANNTTMGMILSIAGAANFGLADLWARSYADILFTDISNMVDERVKQFYENKTPEDVDLFFQEIDSQNPDDQTEPLIIVIG